MEWISALLFGDIGENHQILPHYYILFLPKIWKYQNFFVYLHHNLRLHHKTKTTKFDRTNFRGKTTDEEKTKKAAEE